MDDVTDVGSLGGWLLALWPAFPKYRSPCFNLPRGSTTRVLATEPVQLVTLEVDAVDHSSTQENQQQENKEREPP